MKTPIIDLTHQYPRSPREFLGGFAHLARMIDKVRAKEGGKLGEYIYPCPLDKRLLDFLGVEAEDFYRAVIEKITDVEILDWVNQNGLPRSPEEIENWNREFLTRKPDNPESLDRFLELRNTIAPDRKDISAWADLLDLDEGRPVPVRHNPL